MRITIAGTEYKAKLTMGSLEIADLLNSQVNNCSFQITLQHGDVEPTYAQEVVIYDQYESKLFAGFIEAVNKRTQTTVSGVSILSVECIDYTQYFLRQHAQVTYSGVSLYAVVSGLVNTYAPNLGITISGIDQRVPGPTITTVKFNRLSLRDSFDKLRSRTNYEWYIDYDKVLWFFLTAPTDAPEQLTDSSNNFSWLSYKPDISQLRNRITVKGSTYISANFAQSIITNGIAKEWLLREKPKNWISLTENVPASGTTYTRVVGIDPLNPDAGYEYKFNYQEKYVRLASGITTPSGTILTATYQYEIPVLVRRSDSASIAAMVALQGGQGIYDHFLYDPTITSKEEARNRANAELVDFANPITQGEFETETRLITPSGVLRSGQSININLPSRGLNDSYLIREVNFRQFAGNPDEFFVNVKFGGRLYGFKEYLEKLAFEEVDIKDNEELDIYGAYNIENITLVEAVESSTEHNLKQETITIGETATNRGLNYGTYFATGSNVVPSGVARQFILTGSPLVP